MHLGETPDEPFLFWSAACSTGAEAYSYAMYIHRLLARAKATCPFHVFATDINQKLIESAKVGEYKVSQSDRDDYRAYFERYGTLSGDKVRFGKEIQKFISFSAFDLKRTPRKKGFRMLVCANVFQYYDDDARVHFMENFMSAVARPGYIFVGPLKDHIVQRLGLTKLTRYKMFLVE
jgi:chemotaxis methyl-accepting protein methylase